MDNKLITSSRRSFAIVVAFTMILGTACSSGKPDRPHSSDLTIDLVDNPIIQDEDIVDLFDPEFDSDNDGVVNKNDAFPEDSSESFDSDNDGIGDNQDTDDDNDGVLDDDDAFPNEPLEQFDTDGDGIGDNADADDDNDGVEDERDAFPRNANEDADNDGDGIGNNADLDDDNDGVNDDVDLLPFDASEQFDHDGDGIGNNADDDDDNDGVNDAQDVFPLNANEHADSDEDGVGNNADDDDDNDGIPDRQDAQPFNGLESVDTDGDGIGNNADLDDDNDGVSDETDHFPLDATESLDTDNDGQGNNADSDDDDDGVLDDEDAFPLNKDESLDTDNDGIGNNADMDDDADGIIDETDAFPLDPLEHLDTDSDGIGNSADDDDDNDGVTDAEDVFPLDASESLDMDHDGIGNNIDTDDDNDGVTDAEDAFPFDANESLDTDNDGVGNNADADDDNDGVADEEDVLPLVVNDTEPDNFIFETVVDREFDIDVESNTVSISGINVSTPVTITGGMYRVNDSEPKSEPSVIDSGATITLIVRSSNVPGTTTEAVLTVGSTQQTFSVTTVQDLEAPTLSIAFPPPVSMTESSSAFIRGSVSDDMSEIDRVIISVNGEENSLNEFQSEDDELAWSSNIALIAGINTVEVTAVDAAGNASSVHNLTIKQGAIDDISEGSAFPNNNVPLIYPVSIALDNANNRILIGDREHSAIIAVDATTGERTIFAELGSTDSYNDHAAPEGMLIDPDNNRLFVADLRLDNLLAVELSTGEQTLIADNEGFERLYEFRSLREMVINPNDQEEILVVDQSSGIWGVNSETGARRVFSDDHPGRFRPDTELGFSSASGLAVDVARNRLLAVDRHYYGVLAISLDDGGRSIVSDNASDGDDSFFTTPRTLIVDPDNNRAVINELGSYAAQEGVASLISMDLDSGERTYFSSPTIPNTANALVEPQEIFWDGKLGYYLVIDRRLNALLAIDTDTGERVIYSKSRSNSIDDQGPESAIEFPPPVSYTESTNVLLRGVVSDALSGISRINVFVDAQKIENELTLETIDGEIHWRVRAELPEDRNYIVVEAWDDTGNMARQSVIVYVGVIDNGSADSAFPNNDNDIVDPVSIAYDRNRGRFLVGDRYHNVILGVDPRSGKRTIVSDNDTPDGVNPFVSPYGMLMDPFYNESVFVTDPGASALLEVDLETGSRDIYSDSAMPNNELPLQSPRELMINPRNNNEILVVDEETGINAVNRTTRARRLFTDASPGFLTSQEAGQAYVFSGIAYDSSSDKILVVDSLIRSVIEINPDDGTGTLIDSTTAEGDKVLLNPSTLIIDTNKNAAIINDIGHTDDIVGTPQLVTMNLETETFDVFSSPTIPDDVNAFAEPQAIFWDRQLGYYLVVDRGLRGLIAVDVSSGERVFITKSSSCSHSVC